MSLHLLQALVFNIRYEARDIVSVELRPATPDILFPRVEPGAHIDLHLDTGLVRSYSLINPGETDRYVVAVLKDRASRGGSRYVHENLRVGEIIAISAPRNHFHLHEEARLSVLLAGGIGITPLVAMLKHLSALGRQAHLIYCARSQQDAAFLAEIKELVAGSKKNCITSHFYFDDEQGAPPDITRLLSSFPPNTHFYSCGPGRMLEAYEKACAQLGYKNVHMERFAAIAVPGDRSVATEGYEVELRRSNKTIHVSPGTTLLDALLAAGCEVESSCREGLCGSCETRVLSGEVEHRDSILTKEERAANKSMMICVSSCRSGTLVLDA